MTDRFRLPVAGRRRLVAAAALLPMAGCTLVPERPAPLARHDFGPVPPAPATIVPLPAPLAIGTVVAPDWLDGTALAYRLLWDAPGRLRAYAATGWAAPPSARSRPVARWGITTPRSANMSSTWPPSTSASAGPVPL